MARQHAAERQLPRPSHRTRERQVTGGPHCDLGIELAACDQRVAVIREAGTRDGANVQALVHGQHTALADAVLGAADVHDAQGGVAESPRHVVCVAQPRVHGRVVVSRRRGTRPLRCAHLVLARRGVAQRRARRQDQHTLTRHHELADGVGGRGQLRRA